MVRFKNRYILVDYIDMPFDDQPTERTLLRIIKETSQNMMGELFLAKIAYSLQIKYFSHGRAIIRVPRDHATDLQACLFVIRGMKVLQISGVIRGIQKRLFELMRRELRRELTENEEDTIKKIDYA